VRRVICLSAITLLLVLSLTVGAWASAQDEGTTVMGGGTAISEGGGPVTPGFHKPKRLAKTGGPAIPLLTGALLLGSGILAYTVLRRAR
jgi:hypothetical protein